MKGARLFDIFPTSLLLSSVLVPGGAFRAEYECLDEGLKLRFFFVINKRPETDEPIIMLTSTTKIEERRRHHGRRADQVLVPISPDEYPSLDRPSVLDCESPVKRKRAVFLAGVQNREYLPLPPLPERILERIRAGVSAARGISPIHKRLVLGSERDDDESRAATSATSEREEPVEG